MGIFRKYNLKISGIVVLAIFVFLVVAANAKPSISIKIEPGQWGDSQLPDIKKVLESAASELTANVTSLNNISVIVRHDEEGPKTLYKKGNNGEFIVLLDVEDRRWSQFSYQFSHEFAHVLMMNRKKATTPNQWFEEAIGEVASLFAIRKMGRSWRVNPPYPNWKDYSSSLSEYAEDQFNESHRKLPTGQTFVRWFKANESSLRNDPYQREKDELIANQLLPFFEAYPEGWDTITYLNKTKPSATQTFTDYLSEWHRNAPQRHRSFITKLAGLFELKIS